MLIWFWLCLGTIPTAALVEDIIISERSIEHYFLVLNIVHFIFILIFIGVFHGFINIRILETYCHDIIYFWHLLFFVSFYDVFDRRTSYYFYFYWKSSLSLVERSFNWVSLSSEIEIFSNYFYFFTYDVITTVGNRIIICTQLTYASIFFENMAS